MKKPELRNITKREKVAYIGSNESNQELDIAFGDVETKEVEIAERKPGPPYTCNSLRLSDGNNPIEPSNEKYVHKTYTFDVTKCNEIYDLLVADGQVVVPKDLKISLLEQRQKIGFCKYHNYLGHKTSRCSLFVNAYMIMRICIRMEQKGVQYIDEIS